MLIDRRRRRRGPRTITAATPRGRGAATTSDLRECPPIARVVGKNRRSYQPGIVGSFFRHGSILQRGSVHRQDLGGPRSCLWILGKVSTLAAALFLQSPRPRHCLFQQSRRRPGASSGRREDRPRRNRPRESRNHLRYFPGRGGRGGPALPVGEGFLLHRHRAKGVRNSLLQAY